MLLGVLLLLFEIDAISINSTLIQLMLLVMLFCYNLLIIIIIMHYCYFAMLFCYYLIIIVICAPAILLLMLFCYYYNNE